MAPALPLRAHLQHALGWRTRPALELVPTGIAGLDALTGGLPRGAITDLYGPASSGRTSLAMAILAQATARQEVCALVDAADSFDPGSAAAGGVDLGRLLWIRCGGRPDHALKAADLLIQGGGFGYVVLDLAGVAPRLVRRIPLTAWFRFQRAIENTPAVLLVVEEQPTVKSCAALMLEMKREDALWSGTLLRGLRYGATPRKPVCSQTAAFEARAVG